MASRMHSAMRSRSSLAKAESIESIGLAKPLLAQVWPKSMPEVSSHWGNRPAVGARALSDRKIREEAGHRDELPEGHQSLLHAPQRRRPRRPRGRRVVRIGLRVIDRHLAVSVEGNLARRPSTDNGRPTYRDGSGYAADRPKSRHIGLHGAGTRRPFGEMPPMRP